VITNSLTNIDKTVKIIAQVILGGRYIDFTKLICDVFTRSNHFFYFKGWFPFKLKNIYKRLNYKERAGE
jgi:hypothetical protein